MFPPVKVGDRVKITGVMQNEPNPIPIGTVGTVTHVGKWTDEYTRQCSVNWDNGSQLILLGDDPFVVLPHGEME